MAEESCEISGPEPVDVVPGLLHYVRWPGPSRLAYCHDHDEPLVPTAPGTCHGVGYDGYGHRNFGADTHHSLVDQP